MHRLLHCFIVLICLFTNSISHAQHDLMGLIPTNAATHTAQQSGDWFSASTWAEGTIPGDAAIVHIPAAYTVTYEGQSSAHIFAIRVDGTFLCTQGTSADTTTLTFDTFTGTMNSLTQFHADDVGDGSILVSIKPFDIEAHKLGTSGYSQSWNTMQWIISAIVQLIIKSFGILLVMIVYKTYALAQAGDMERVKSDSVVVDDGAGILGRSGWDSTQLSIGLSTMGELEIIGQEKSVMAKLNADALKNTNSLTLENSPDGWEVGDTILISLGGNKDATSNATELAEIASISGSTITTNGNIKKITKADPKMIYIVMSEISIEI